MEKLALSSEQTVFIERNPAVVPEAYRYSQELDWSSQRARQAFNETLHFIQDLEGISLKDGTKVGRLTAEHSLEVAKLSRMLAEEWIGIPAASDMATTGGLAHDVGKLQIAANHPDLLDPRHTYDDEGREYRIMAEHTRYGFDALLDYTQAMRSGGIDETKPNMLPEAVVARLHHHAKRRNQVNNGPALTEEEDLWLEAIRLIEPELHPERMRAVLLAVSVADTYNAVMTREYVPAEHLLKPENKLNVVEWLTTNIDATQIGLKPKDALDASKALVNVLERESGNRIAHSDHRINGELNALRKSKWHRIGKRITGAY